MADFDASGVRRKIKKPKVQNIISLQYLEIDRPRGTDQIFEAEKKSVAFDGKQKLESRE